MKFVPTSLFLSICNGASKYLQWKVYVKKTTDLSEALTAGTWVEVTDRVEIPSLAMSIEANVGSSTSDKLTLEGSGIAWWVAQVFNATVSQYIEIKITCQIGLSETKLATDLCYEFYGYAEKKYTVTESTDTISFEVYSADDFLAMLPAELLSKQVSVPNLDGAGLEGLFLQSIPGVYITNANIASFALHQGVHEIKYSLREGDKMLTLDGGVEVVAAEGLNTLISEDTEEKVKVYCRLAECGSADATCEIIVLTAGTTLPRTWISGLRVRDALALIYTQIGLTDFTFEEWQLDTFDARRVTSFFEVPPAGTTFYGKTYSIAYEDSNTTLYLGVKDRLYKRSMTTHAYTLLATPSSGWQIRKIFTERIASDGYLWLWLYDGTNNKIARITVADNTVALYAVSAAYEQAVCYASGIGGASGSLLYWVKAGSYVKAFDLATPAEANFNAAFSLISAVIDQSGGCTNGTDTYYTTGTVISPAGPGIVAITAAGDAVLRTTAISSLSMELAYTTGRLLFSFSTDGIYSYVIASDTLTLEVAGELICPYAKAGTVHFVRRLSTGELYIASYAGGAISCATESIRYLMDAMDVGQYLTYDTANTRNLFITLGGSMLGQFYAKVSVFISAETSFRGETLRGALNTILESYMMLGKITADKKVKVYRRFNASGTPVNSGSTFAVTINSAEDIIKSVRYSEAVKWLEVSNGDETHSYDGTNWDEQLFTADRKLAVSSKLIPSNIVKDVCYYLWQFFSVDHHLYEIPLANVTPLHLEAFDGLAVTFTGNRITESGTLVIYGISVEQDGYMKIKGLK
jgi:hypothetical protein